ncbi:pimeloyl-ACP methyl ester carboxylesterase [Crossiella equi]|uniref:Pimeloyl-ACP methyl ester carboxylesterase n=1 Tax=Crossiella equi TaxID=130796 RepID=A0ABS5ABS3_9PSEU|nr:alpha/beta fold hydrolase [Crossiella equi]MBP2474029.1 pimeloyl-ACP methyl ester carboxylesterase [Crossiella equi]
MPGDPRIPRLAEWPVDQTRALVLLLHGGREHSHDRPHRGSLAYLRMLPFARDLHREGARLGLGVWLLRYRFRGWNAPEEDPVRDADWALDEAARRHPGVPVVLVGHSMGGRTALRVHRPGVAGIAALAPWLPEGEPVGQLSGGTVLIAHGDRERWTDPRLSYRYALRAREVASRVCRFDVHGENHAMLRRAAEWTALVRRFTFGALGFGPWDTELDRAFALPAPEGLRVPLAGRAA